MTILTVCCYINRALNKIYIFHYIYSHLNSLHAIQMAMLIKNCTAQFVAQRAKIVLFILVDNFIP